MGPRVPNMTGVSREQLESRQYCLDELSQVENPGKVFPCGRSWCQKSS